MAQPTTSLFSEFAIHLGDGATPTEAFTFICGLTSKGLSLTNETSTTLVPDCADEDAPAYNEKSVNSQSAMISGSGVFPRERQEELLEWWRTGEARNVRVYPGKSNTGDVHYIAGPAILESLELTGERGQKLSCSLSIGFSALPTFVAKT